MGERLQSRTYTCYSSPSCDYRDFCGAPWVHISGKQLQEANLWINQLDKKIFFSSGSKSNYLFQGSVIQTNHALTDTPNKGWSIRLISETKKGIEKLAKILKLPLENE